MNYKITDGLEQKDLNQWLKKAISKYGTFADGRINYKSANIAPIIMCTVIYQNKILLVKRNRSLTDARNYWSTVNGYIDKIKPIKQLVAQKIKVELGLDINTQFIKIASSYTLDNSKEIRQYIVFPCLITLDTEPTIILNQENTEFSWITRDKLTSYFILDDLPIAIDNALNLDNSLINT